jgi:hypothetical protein
MSENVIERNGSECKYVEIFTHRVGSIGAPSRRTVFIRQTNTKLLEVPKIVGRNTKVNIFQKGSAGFKATNDMNKKKVLQSGVSVYVTSVDLISLRHQYKYMEHKGKTIETDGRKLLLDALKLIGISRIDGVPN